MLTNYVLADLSSRCNSDETLPPKAQIGRYHSRTVPAVSIQKYISSALLPLARNPEETMAVAYIFALRLARDAEVPLNSLTLHRLMLSCCLLATKILQDEIVSNKLWAAHGGISLHELNLLEASTLKRLNWECTVSVEEYQALRRDSMSLEPEQKAAAQPVRAPHTPPLSSHRHMPSTDMDESDSVSLEDVSLELGKMSLGATQSADVQIQPNHEIVGIEVATVATGSAHNVHDGYMGM